MSIGTEFTTGFLAAFREARTSDGLSQQAVADAMADLGHTSWHQTTVAKTEAGARPLLLSEAVDLAKLVGVIFATGSAAPCKRFVSGAAS